MTKPRVLIVHNAYGSAAPSGENEVVRIETALLREHGHDVLVVERQSDEIRGRGLVGAAHGAVAVPWNPFMARRIAKAIAAFAPHVLHAHNIFPLISPSVFYAARGGPARVLTLHNYRLLCAAAIPMRAGAVCTDCIDGRSALPGLLRRCYRGSIAATLPLTIGIAAHRRMGTWQREVEAFVALTEFQRQLLARGGLPPDRIEVKPNFYPSVPAVVPWSERDASCVYVGRLSPEKGVAKLVRAWKAWGTDAPPLRVIGDGPLRADLEALAQGANITFLGQRPNHECQAMIGRVKLVIVPSECFEGFPMVVREAFAFGTAVAVSEIGPLPAMVDHGRCGLLLHPTDVVAARDRLRSAWHDEAHLQAYASAGRQEFLARYTADANYEHLVGIYERALARKPTR